MRELYGRQSGAKGVACDRGRRGALAGAVLAASCAPIVTYVGPPAPDVMSAACPVRPTPIDAPAQPYVAQLEMEQSFQFAVMSDGTVRSRGGNHQGSLGLGTSTLGTSRPEPVPGLRDVAEVRSMFYNTACARTRQGEVWCWGRNEADMLGNDHVDDDTCAGAAGDIPCRLAPTRALGLTGATRIVVGSRQVCALRGDGSVWCWGASVYTPSSPPQRFTRPTRIEGVEGVVDLFPHGGGIAFVRTDGTVLPADTRIPAPATLPVGARTFSREGASLCTLLPDRTLRCWGTNFYGMTGLPPGNTLVPTPNDPGLRCVERVVMGTSHLCAIHTDGAVSCWGLNDDGEAGVAPERSAECRSDRVWRCVPRPTRVAGIDRVVDLAVRPFQTCAIRDDRSVWCWGSLEGRTTHVPERVMWWDAP